MYIIKSRKEEKGFTVIELLVAAGVIGILLALAIPNFIKARISSNEANARKAMQVLRDAEAQYSEQDMDNDRVKDYTNQIGNLATGGTLRCPSSDGNANTGDCVEEDSLIDESFEDAIASGVMANCADSKAGYCIQFAGDVDGSNPVVLQSNFGWKASMISAHKTGIRDFAVYADEVIRCTFSQEARGEAGKFRADRTSPACNG